jgi:hypothetical protein
MPSNWVYGRSSLFATTGSISAGFSKGKGSFLERKKCSDCQIMKAAEGIRAGFTPHSSPNSKGFKSLPLIPTTINF